MRIFLRRQAIRDQVKMSADAGLVQDGVHAAVDILQVIRAVRDDDIAL